MTIPNLPADPEGMNEERAGWARIAVERFARETGQDYRTDGWEEIIGDLLANIMHLCDRVDVSFTTAFQRAVTHYHEETGVPRPWEVREGALLLGTFESGAAAQQFHDGLPADRQFTIINTEAEEA